MSTRPKILAIDLDDTLLHDKHPDLGEPVDGIVFQLEALKAAGWVIVIWTVRDEDEKIAKHLKKLGVPFDYINDHPWNFKNSSRKIFADLYLDNRALNFNGETRGLAEKINSFRPWPNHVMGGK